MFICLRPSSDILKVTAVHRLCLGVRRRRNLRLDSLVKMFMPRERKSSPFIQLEQFKRGRIMGFQ